jgi:hypothetical protein
VTALEWGHVEGVSAMRMLVRSGGAEVFRSWKDMGGRRSREDDTESDPVTLQARRRSHFDHALHDPLSQPSFSLGHAQHSPRSSHDQFRRRHYYANNSFILAAILN